MQAVWNQSIARLLILPGGILLICAAVIAHSGWIALPEPSLNFLYYCALIGGALLAWRFHSSRTLLALLVVYLSQQARFLVASPHAMAAFPVALAAVGVLIPLNFVLIAFMQERGFTLSAVSPPLLFIFVQTVFAAVLASGSESSLPVRHRASISLPDYVWGVVAVAGLMLLARSLHSRKPSDGALFWSLAAWFFSFYFRANTRVSAVYSLAAPAILALSIVETSYLFAYHDELTGLPSRRAFNDALHRLQAPYSIATVDIDHFKSFNDTYGHDVGDQVLRLVASKLACVTGGGHAYRCGGEEFTILFPGKLTPEVVPHLEQLRLVIEGAHFRMRGNERRQALRGPDRRSGGRNRARKADAIRRLSAPRSTDPVSVTVSVGVAGCASAASGTDQVLLAADKALYRAKANGRNRIELAPTRRPGRAKAAEIA